MLNGSLESGRLTGEVRPDEAKTAKNGPTEVQWLDEERTEAEKLTRSSMEAPFWLRSHRTSGSSGKCRVNAQAIMPRLLGAQDAANHVVANAHERRLGRHCAFRRNRRLILGKRSHRASWRDYSAGVA